MTAVAAAVWFLAHPVPVPARPVTRFSVVLPPGLSSFTIGQGRPAIALSPDGTRLVYGARIGSGNSQLYSRMADQVDAAPIRGTELAQSPFFSPDGQWIGFFSQDLKIKKVPVGGGATFTVCDAIAGGGATWLPDDSIIFRPGPAVGLWRGFPGRGTPPKGFEAGGENQAPILLALGPPGGEEVVVSIQ